MSSFDSQRQESLKRSWSDNFNRSNSPYARFPTLQLQPSTLSSNDQCLVTEVVPPVTVVLEGRSICQRISLNKHESYQSLARVLRQMFVESSTHQLVDHTDDNDKNGLDLSNAIPGYLIAYEDMENDLLLAGDLNWK